MPSSKEYLDFVLEQLSPLEGITHRMMMGEYIIYYNGKVAALICDDRLLIKPVESAQRIMPDALREPPYNGAKDMLLCDMVDNGSFLCELFKTIYPELPEPRRK